MEGPADPVSRIVVIGAGLGGLAAAARLAAAGHAVTVCEQAADLGGKLSTAQHDGYRWDTGPSLLTLPSVLEDLFSATGAPLEGSLLLRRIDPIARYRFADGTMLDAPGSIDDFCQRVDTVLQPGSGDDWRRLMERAADIWHVVEQPFLRSPLHGARTLARLAMQARDVRTIAPLQTLRGLGSRYLRDPRLRMFLDRYATYTGSDPRKAPATLAVVPYVEQAFGGWYVEGGLYRMVEAVADRARDRGAVIRTDAGVAAVLVEGGRATGVRLEDGEILSAEVVVANADAAHLYRDLLPRSVAAKPLRDLHRATPSLSGFVLLLALKGTTRDLQHHTVLFPRNYDAEFDAIFSARPRPVADPALYIAAPRDDTRAPAGGEAWFVLANAPRAGAVPWEDRTASDYAEHLLGVLAARGLDVRERIEHMSVRSPLELQERTRAPGGAIYGTSSNGARSAFLRPANSSPVPGLFLVGGSSHPGGGLPLVLLSAEIVSRLVGPSR